jgi:hypothetical protein
MEKLRKTEQSLFMAGVDKERKTVAGMQTGVTGAVGWSKLEPVTGVGAVCLA